MNALLGDQWTDLPEAMTELRSDRNGRNYTRGENATPNRLVNSAGMSSGARSIANGALQRKLSSTVYFGLWVGKFSHCLFYDKSFKIAFISA
jgi:hypothetical protein